MEDEFILTVVLKTDYRGKMLLYGETDKEAKCT